MDVIQTLALSLGSAWASGINLYAAVAVIGIMGAYGGVHLPPGMEILANPLVIGVALFMYVVEFFADKIPGFDTLWDAIHTFVRIPAGAILAARGMGHIDPALQLAAGLLGGTLAAASHATKAGTRVLINTSPEPFTNWAASFTEDLAVIGGMWTALRHPYLFCVLLAIAIGAMFVFLPVLWRGIQGLARGIARLFGAGGREQAAGTQKTT